MAPLNAGGAFSQTSYSALRCNDTLLDAAEQVWSRQKILRHAGSAITGVPPRNIPTTNSGFLLDTTSAVPQNSPNFSKGAFVFADKLGKVQIGRASCRERV